MAYMTFLCLSGIVHDAGFLKGVGKGVVGAIAQPISGGLDFASSAFEGIDATKDQLIGRPRAGTANRRLRLPRAIGGDGKVTAFIGSDGTEKEVMSWHQSISVATVFMALAPVSVHPRVQLSGYTAGACLCSAAGDV